jgi:predicted AAA+ superfamily ATPase
MSAITTTKPLKQDADWLRQHWQRARQLAAKHNGESPDQPFVFAIDEIQRVNKWSETVKGLWDADRHQRFPMHVVLLGSSPLLMQKGLTESLAGRFELIPLSHWSYTEMSEAFNFGLEDYVYFGGYPGAAGFIREEPRWRQYVRASLIAPNIERDILMMSRVEKPALLKRLFELSCSYSGQILSFTKMLGQLQDAGNVVTLAHYLDLLSNAGLVAGIQKYAGQKVRQRAASPKLNVLNTGLMAALCGYTQSEARADKTFWGRLVESAVGAHLYNTLTSEYQLYHWRDGVHEVDYVLQRGRRLLAIEVKSGRVKTHVTGLAVFQQRFQGARSMIVGEGYLSIAEFFSYPAGHWLDE